MAKTRTKTRRSGTSLKKKTKKTERRGSAASVTPSWIRPEATARKVGRPSKLTRALIERFMVYVERGLHLDQCAALLGVAASMSRAWLRDGARDLENGERTIHAEFSAAVTSALARLQLRGVDTLTVYQRMAEGWDPTCATCERDKKPCGAHPKQLKLAADLARWLLSHRFPRQWAPGTVPALLAGDQDGGAPAASSSGDGVPAPAAFGALVFLPARPRDDLE